MTTTINFVGIKPKAIKYNPGDYYAATDGGCYVYTGAGKWSCFDLNSKNLGTYSTNHVVSCCVNNVYYTFMRKPKYGIGDQFVYMNVGNRYYVYRTTMNWEYFVNGESQGFFTNSYVQKFIKSALTRDCLPAYKFQTAAQIIATQTKPNPISATGTYKVNDVFFISSKLFFIYRASGRWARYLDGKPSGTTATETLATARFSDASLIKSENNKLFFAIEHGLYRINWKSGGTSLASVGSTHSGKRWYAPTNWVSTDSPSPSVTSTDWDVVQSVEYLNV